MKPSRFTKVKIALGYLLLLMAVFFSLTFIRKEMKKLSDSDDMQSLQTDSIFYWLDQKDKNMLQMLQELATVNDSVLTISEINERIARLPEPAIEQPKPVVQQRVVTKRDSIVATPTKKGFFKRLGEVFVPPKADSTAVVVKTTSEVERDTLLQKYTVVYDTLPQTVQTVVTQKQVPPRKKPFQWRNEHYRQLNAELTARIDSVVRGYEHEALERIRHNAETGREIRRHSTETIGRVAVGAVILSAIFLIFIWRDISRSNRYRRELEKANRRTEKLLVAREKMMLAITHDFKAPLGSIIGYSELLAGLVTDERQQFYLGNMKTSSEHLLKLVGDLLEFHRLDLNKTEVHRMAFYPTQLFEEIYTCFEPLARSKGLQLQYHIEPEVQGCFTGDPLRIRQITDNLLSNAVKFTSKGEVRLDVSYADSMLQIEVSDTGKGMAPADQKRIFQEFTRLTGAQGEEGFGLGLSIVKKLVRLLNGKVDVESTLGDGSRFIVSLPLTRATYVPDEAEKVYGMTSVPAQPEKKIRLLLIDDDKIQLQLTSAMLHQQGFESVCCEQPEELFEHLRTGQFDILLTDVQMPAMNGFDLLKLLRASNIPQAQTVPAIAVTARSEMNDQEFVRHGFVGCLHKPFSVKELHAVIGRLTADLNFAALLAFSEGDAEASLAIIESFIDETGKNIARMEEAYEQSDANGVAAMAHKLLPLLTMIGATRTVPLLMWLEIQRGKIFSDELKRRTGEALLCLHAIVDEAKIYAGKLGKEA